MKQIYLKRSCRLSIKRLQGCPNGVQTEYENFFEFNHRIVSNRSEI